MNPILKRIQQMRLVPMVVMDRAEHAEGFGDALVSGGLPIAEITFRTVEAEAAVRHWPIVVICWWAPARS